MKPDWLDKIGNICFGHWGDKLTKGLTLLATVIFTSIVVNKLI